MLKRLRYVAGSTLLCTSLSLTAMVFDNRYFPLYQKPFLRRPDMRMYFNVQPFIMGAADSFADLPSEGNVNADTAGLFEIDGPYNEAVINKALQVSGRTQGSLLRSDLSLLDVIPWTLNGTLEAYGTVANFYVPWGRYFGFGGSFLYMAAHAALDSQLEKSGIMSTVLGSSVTRSLYIGDIAELYTANAQMQELLGLSCGLWHQRGWGDIDLYLRAGKTSDYSYKFRTIDVGASLGVLIPTAKPRDINNPAAMSFGGNKHWGVYGSVDADLELKEDMRCGLLFRVSKRFKRAGCARMPALTEPALFGAIVGKASVTPGFTYIFVPYFQVGALRDGFGLRFMYNFVYHSADCWTDKRCNQTVPANLMNVCYRSQWASEAVSLAVIYDFAQDKEVRGRTPTIYLNWDIPVDWLGATRSNRTQSISLTIESYL